METSLRYGGANSKALRIHAKEKFSIDAYSYLKVHGELDTGLGAPSSCSAVIKSFHPNLSTSLGLGFLYSKHDNLRYSLRGKKAFSVTTDGLLSLNIKGRYDTDGWREATTSIRKPSGAAELTWSILNFKRDQDVRIKVGYEVFEQVPYLQIRENNWTLNAAANGRWNVRFDL